MRRRFVLEIGNLRISLPDDEPETIEIMRGDEGGRFALRDFVQLVHDFISEQL